MTTPIGDPQHRWTAAELRRLPADERDAILAAAAALAADEYRNDAALTAFEAFGEGESSANQALHLTAAALRFSKVQRSLSRRSR